MRKESNNNEVFVSLCDFCSSLAVSIWLLVVNLSFVFKRLLLPGPHGNNSSPVSGLEPKWQTALFLLRRVLKHI
jgi:hypothetical protein